MSKDGSMFLDFSQVDPVVIAAEKDISSGHTVFTDYRTTYKKIRSAYDKTFEIDHLSDSGKGHRPDMFRSALGRIQTEIAKKSIKMPEVEIKPLISISESINIENLEEEQIKEIENSNKAKALYEWFVREAKVSAVEKKGREYWLGMGDQFSRPHAKKLANGKYCPRYENMRPDMVIADPNGTSVDSGETSTDYQFLYFVRILTRDMVITDYGEEILKYIKPDGKLFSASEFVEIPEKGQNIEYYLEFSGQNKAQEHDVALLGGGMFPVRRYSEKEFVIPKVKGVTKDSLKKELSKALDHKNKYIYKDSNGEPYINVVHKSCYQRDDSPYGYGIQQKVYNIQAIQEYTENGKVDNFRRSLEELVWATNIRRNQLDQAYDDYNERKRTDIRAILTLPPTYGSNAPQIGSLDYPQINPITSQQITDDIVRLARNAVGVDPNRVEIQKAEGLGIREMLTEERVETIQDIVEDSEIAIEKGVEKIINFLIVHEGLGLNNVFITYDGFAESPIEGVRYVRKKAESIVDIAKSLKGWNYNTVVSIDSMLRKSNALAIEKIFSFLERVDPNAYPDLYKKLIIKLNEVFPINIASQDLVQKAPAEALGGASQFKNRTRGGGQALQAPGGIPGQAGAIQEATAGQIASGLGSQGQQIVGGI